MGLMIWLLGFFSKLLVGFLCLFAILMVVTLDAAANCDSGSKKENLDEKKNGVKKASKAGAVKKSKKNKRVGFMDDVVMVRRSNDANNTVPQKLVEGVDQLRQGLFEQAGFLADSSEGGLVVGREDDGNVMVEDVVDAVVVRSVCPLDHPDKPTEGFESSGEISVTDGHYHRWSEEAFERDQGVEVMADKESEAMVSGEVSVGGCGDVSMIKDVERAVESNNIGMAARAEIGEENDEIIVWPGAKDSISCSDGVKDSISPSEGVEDSISCSEGVGVEQEIKIDAVGSEERLEIVNNNDRVENCSDESEGVAEFLEPELQLQGECLDDKSGLKLTSEDCSIDNIGAFIRENVANDPTVLEDQLGRHAVPDEDRMVVTNYDIAADERDTVVGKSMADVGEHLEGELDGETVDDKQGIPMNSVVGLDEGDAVAGDIESSEVLERGAVEDKNDKISGGEKDNIPLVTGELENLAVEEVSNCEHSCNKDTMESVSDNVASPLLEAGRVGRVGEEVVLRDNEVHDNDNGGNEDDDWEGVERSELEKVFAEAVNYVEYEWKLKYNNWSANSMSDTPKRLYGLHKLATRGPCHVPPPMALRVTARAKWNAWQSLGNMSQEAAMEEYIKILSDADPGWIQYSTTVGFSTDMKSSSNIKGRLPSHLTDLKLQEGDAQASFEAGVEGSLDNKLTSSEEPQNDWKEPIDEPCYG